MDIVGDMQLPEGFGLSGKAKNVGLS